MHEPVKILARHVTFRAQKHIQNQIALRRALQTLLLYVLEENFLFFSH